MAFRVVRKKNPLFRPWDAAAGKQDPHSIGNREHNSSKRHIQEAVDTQKACSTSSSLAISRGRNSSTTFPDKVSTSPPKALENVKGSGTVHYSVCGHPQANESMSSVKVESDFLSSAPISKYDLPTGLQNGNHRHTMQSMPSTHDNSVTNGHMLSKVFPCERLSEWTAANLKASVRYAAAEANMYHPSSFPLHPFAAAEHLSSLYPTHPFIPASSGAPGSILDGGLQARWRAKKQRPKRFQCPHCKVSFSNNGQLKGHVRIHTGERPFACDHPDCGKTFTRNEELTRHKRIHSGLRPFACALCGKSFGRKDHLKKHVRTHQRAQMIPISMPPLPGMPYLLGPGSCVPAGWI